MARWFCKIGGKQYGPYAEQDLRRLVDEGRLLPDDHLRDGRDGGWFPADEMHDLFRRPARDDADDFDDEEDRDLPRRKKGKPSNYFQILSQNLWASDAQWKKILTIVMVLLFVLPLVVAVFSLFTAMATMGRAGLAGVIVGLVWAPVLPLTMGLIFFADALLFGLVCKAFAVRLDKRYHGVLDLFAFCYLIAMAPLLIRFLVGLANRKIGLLLGLLDPVVQAVVLGYFIYSSWGLSGQRAWLLAGARFGYQMLFMILYVVLMYVLFFGD
jgi:hypothetical protein